MTDPVAVTTATASIARTIRLIAEVLCGVKFLAFSSLQASAARAMRAAANHRSRPPRSERAD
ncbi:hypothetical protein BZM26_01885 [Paraburkholderia strydomiana]|nr:hypothetical protein BZM26_01885 [Paraburkholderia strydomiana]